MTLELKTSARLLDLHCSVGLMDWDMHRELKLPTTTDQLLLDEKLKDQHAAERPSAGTLRKSDPFVWNQKTPDGFKPSLWLLVNPNLVCPVQYERGAAEAVRGVAEAAERLFTDQPSSAQRETKKAEAFRRPAKSRRMGRTTKVMDVSALKPGCWPRPPVNYCILIALALKSSHTGCLKVQQIYNFTRENFPFFQTAPDGWKNTIRHNLCFNSSFRKTCNQLCRDGKRKSCFWHLTLDGHRRLKDEVHLLTGDTLKQLQRSMSQPARPHESDPYVIDTLQTTSFCVEVGGNENINSNHGGRCC
ncbi:forkhead box R1 [Oryzias latipes]|uniref:Forkhead box R1 n=1 Tax=Oryzias latipes TaxID=8090 RepID=C1K309_ORYLA|nr:forkhead box protein R1 [Oryzias latipes]ACO57482.1 forkhead box R1 [Oryzias latipes]